LFKIHLFDTDLIYSKLSNDFRDPDGLVEVGPVLGHDADHRAGQQTSLHEVVRVAVRVLATVNLIIKYLPLTQGFPN
jgi:hypothetical protein